MKNKLEVIDGFVYEGVLLDEGDNSHPATTFLPSRGWAEMIKKTYQIISIKSPQ